MWIAACVKQPEAEGESSESSSASDATESGEPTESSDESDTEPGDESDTESGDESDTESGDETGEDPPQYDPLCGEWASTLVFADRLDEVWLDGDELIAAGGRTLLERSGGGEWSDYVDVSLEAPLNAYKQVWGPPGDRWILAYDAVWDTVIVHHDGASLTHHATLPEHPDPQAGPTVPREIIGRGPDDVWALATPQCQCFWLPCMCLDASELLHWDGQSWSVVPTPGGLLDIALTETSVWAVGRSGLVARYDGQDWIVEDLGPTSFEHVWALNDDEVWVAGGPDSEVVRRTGGMWNHVDLPQPFLYIAGLDGHAADRVVALTDSGLLWAYDGVDWSHLTSLDHDADGIALTDDGASLIVAGGDERHVIWQVDVTDGSTELLYEREHIDIGTMIADSVDRALLSSQSRRMTWLVTDDTWERVYDAPPVDRGFAALLGPIDQAIGVRQNLYFPDAVWQLGEQPTALPDPIATGRFHDVIQFDGQLWVAGYQDTWTDRPFAHAWDGTDWTDHSPPLIGSNDSVEKLSAAGDRVYAWLPGTVTDHLMVLDGGDWQTLPRPPVELDMTAYTDIAATAPDRLWVTQTVVGSETLLWLWDGDTWHDAHAMFPQLAGQCCWHRFGETGDGRLWLLSRGDEQAEQLAYYDGIDWVIVETPAEFVGWRDARPQMAVAGDGLVLYDGMLVWQYAFCPIE